MTRWRRRPPDRKGHPTGRSARRQVATSPCAGGAFEIVIDAASRCGCFSFRWHPFRRRRRRRYSQEPHDLGRLDCSRRRGPAAYDHRIRMRRISRGAPRQGVQPPMSSACPLRSADRKVPGVARALARSAGVSRPYRARPPRRSYRGGASVRRAATRAPAHRRQGCVEGGPQSTCV